MIFIIIFGLLLNAFVYADPTIYKVTCLHEASRSCNLEMVKYLVSKAADIDAENLQPDLPLHTACKKGHLEIVKYFIDDLKIGPESKGPYNETCLIMSSKSGHLEIVKYLVSKAADIDARTYDNLPLHYACLRGSLEIVKYFITVFKMDPNSRTSNNQTFLHYASGLGSLEIVKYLVSEGANINVHDENSDLPLHIACSNGHLKIVKYFITDLNMDPNSIDDSNQTCLDLIIRHEYIREEVVDYLKSIK